MTAAAVATSGLTKRFKHQVAVDSLDLIVPSGAVYGFLGPNGSGKTTTIRMLLGLVTPTSGRVELLGQPIPAKARRGTEPGRRPRRRAGLPSLPVGPRRTWPASTPPTARRTPGQHARGSTARSTGWVSWQPRRSATARTRSACGNGSRSPARCCGVATSSSSTSRRTGSTPRARGRSGPWSGRSSDEGTTVLVSSHLLSEVEQMCTHIGVMHIGKLVAQGTSAELRTGVEPEAVVETDQPQEAASHHARARSHRRPHAARARPPGGSVGSHRRRSSPPACTRACRWSGSGSRPPRWRTCSCP